MCRRVRAWKGAAAFEKERLVSTNALHPRRVVLCAALCLLVSLGGLSAHEALWCATRGGAEALGDPSRGRLRMGDPADLVILDTDHLSDMMSRPDANPVWRVVSAGLEPLE